MPAACKCSVIIPTRNRADVLTGTLARLHALSDRAFETIVIDNGSTDGTADLPARFPAVRWIRLSDNVGCAARNIGAAAATGGVLLMLDDDSHPESGVIDALVELFAADRALAGVACRVRLTEPPHRHDAGGVAGIFFNCGGAVRREALLAVGGYPIDYEYYAEEYDLACRLWARGWRVEPRGDLLVWHGRVARNRDNDRMLRLLVRNNVRLWARYGPSPLRDDLIESTLERYARVAEKENAVAGYKAGLAEARVILSAGVRSRPLSMNEFERLMGLDRARATLTAWADKCAARRVAVWGRGKGCEQLIDLLNLIGIGVWRVYDSVRRPCRWRNVEVAPADELNGRDIDGVVVGSLSPGAAQDAAAEVSSRWQGLPVVSPAPWVGASQAGRIEWPEETEARPGALV